MLQPYLSSLLSGRGGAQYSAAQLLQDCHNNNTLYTVLRLDSTYNISHLTDWRRNYGIGEYIENLKNKIQLEQLKHITLLSPETAKDLEELAQSRVSDIDFSQFTTLLEQEITKIDLQDFIVRLKELKAQVN